MLHLKSFTAFLLIIRFIDGHGDEEHCDRCEFDGLDDIDCKDYGLIDNSILVAWNVASEDCMAVFDIQVSTPDPSLICASSSSFVNELRFGSSLTTAKAGLGVSEGGFFDESGGLFGEITIGGQTIDCEAAESDCFNALKTYFESDTSGQEEMQDVCDTLVKAVVTDRQLEQSIIRNRLCLESREGTVIPDVCSPLWEQLEEKMLEFNDTICPGFAFGAQNQTIPGCEEHSDEDNLMDSGFFRVDVFLVPLAGAVLLCVAQFAL